MSYEIKELGVGAILDQGFKLIKDCLGTALGIVGCLMVPAYVVLGIYGASLVGMPPSNATPEEAREFMLRAQAAIIPLIMASYAILLLVVPITSAALIHLFSEKYLGRNPTVGSSFAYGGRRFGPLLWTSVLYGLAVGVGFLLLIVPGIIALFWFYLYGNVVVTERRSGFDALKRSRALMKGNVSKVITIGFLTFVIGAAAGACGQLIPQPQVGAVVQAIMQGFAYILGAAISVVLYYSCLCQHENFDLKRMAEGVAAPAAPTPAGV
jgi:hypothetical protein